MYLTIHNNHIYFEKFNINTIEDEAEHTLVFLHEGLGSVEQWKDFPETLCVRLNIPGIAYDRLGYGKSDPLSKKRTSSYLHEEALEHLPHVLDKLNIKKPILIGHSDGGTIALLFAAHFPDTAAGIITEAAHVFVEDITLRGIREAVTLFRETDLRTRLSRYHGEKTERLFNNWANTWLSTEFRGWDITKEIQSIKSPLLIIQGKNDEYGTPHQLEMIEKYVSGYCEKFLVPNCGHIPHFQAREAIEEKIKNFILSKVLNNN